MADCGVCISGGDYDGPVDFCRFNIQRARKEHQCYECRRVIRRGETYHVAVFKFDGDLTHDRTCMACHEIREAFCCKDESYTIGSLWSDMSDYVFPQMTTGCLERLQTAAAKSYLLERWRAWKFEY